MPGNSGNEGRGRWSPPRRAENRTSRERSEPPSVRRRRQNRDRRRPLYFSQRLRALSAEWTPALYLAVPVPAPGPGASPPRYRALTAVRETNFCAPVTSRADPAVVDLTPTINPAPLTAERNANLVAPITSGGRDRCILGGRRRVGACVRAPSTRGHRPLSGGGRTLAVVSRRGRRRRPERVRATTIRGRRSRGIPQVRHPGPWVFPRCLRRLRCWPARPVLMQASRFLSFLPRAPNGRLCGAFVRLRHAPRARSTVVLTVPFGLRFRLAFDPAAAGITLRAFVSVISGWLRRRARARRIRGTLKTGGVTVIQRFGSTLNLNVHFHTLMIDGVYAVGPGGAVMFHPLPAPTDANESGNQHRPNAAWRVLRQDD